MAVLTVTENFGKIRNSSFNWNRKSTSKQAIRAVLIKMHLSLVFICRENPGRSRILLFPDCFKFCRLMKTRNRRYPWSCRVDGDKSGESGAFLFSRRVPDFCNGRRSFSTNKNLNLYRRGRQRWFHSLERLRFTFTPNGKRKFVQRDQVFPLFFVYCLVLLHKNK